MTSQLDLLKRDRNTINPCPWDWQPCPLRADDLWSHSITGTLVFWTAACVHFVYVWCPIVVDLSLKMSLNLLIFGVLKIFFVEWEAWLGFGKLSADTNILADGAEIMVLPMSPTRRWQTRNSAEDLARVRHMLFSAGDRGGAEFEITRTSTVPWFCRIVELMLHTSLLIFVRPWRFINGRV